MKRENISEANEIDRTLSRLETVLCMLGSNDEVCITDGGSEPSWSFPIPPEAAKDILARVRDDLLKRLESL